MKSERHWNIFLRFTVVSNLLDMCVDESMWVTSVTSKKIIMFCVFGNIHKTRTQYDWLNQLITKIIMIKVYENNQKTTLGKLDKLASLNIYFLLGIFFLIKSYTLIVYNNGLVLYVCYVTHFLFIFWNRSKVFKKIYFQLSYVRK